MCRRRFAERQTPPGKPAARHSGPSAPGLDRPVALPGLRGSYIYPARSRSCSALPPNRNAWLVVKSGHRHRPLGQSPHSRSGRVIQKHPLRGQPSRVVFDFVSSCGRQANQWTTGSFLFQTELSCVFSCAHICTHNITAALPQKLFFEGCASVISSGVETTTRCHLPAMLRTTRNRALPLIIRSYASAAFSNRKISFMECTSAPALNPSVSCESSDVPEYQ